MADAVDNAQAKTETERAAMIAAHRARPAQAIGASICVDCDEAIPEARRQLVRTLRCTNCAGQHERRRGR